MSLDYYRLELEAALVGDGMVALQVARDAAALRVARKEDAPPILRLLGAVAGGAIEPDLARRIIEARPELQQAARDLGQGGNISGVTIGEGTQTGDITIGQVAGRDAITVNVYVGTADHRP